MLTTEVSADSWGRIIDFSADVDGRFGPHGQGVYWQHAANNGRWHHLFKASQKLPVFFDGRMMPRTVAANLHEIVVCKPRGTTARANCENIKE